MILHGGVLGTADLYSYVEVASLRSGYQKFSDPNLLQFLNYSMAASVLSNIHNGRRCLSYSYLVLVIYLILQSLWTCISI